MKNKLLFLALSLCVLSTGCSSSHNTKAVNETKQIGGSEKVQVTKDIKEPLTEVPDAVESVNVELIEDLPTNVIETEPDTDVVEVDPAVDSYVIASDLTLWYASDPVNNYTFELEDYSYTLPCPYSDFEDAGWQMMDGYEFIELEQGSTQYFDMISPDGKEINIGIRNHSKTAKMGNECEVFEIRVTNYEWNTNNDIKMIMPNGAVLGEDFVVNEETVEWTGDIQVPETTNTDDTVYWQFWEYNPATTTYDLGGCSYETTSGRLSQVMIRCDAMGSAYTGE